MARPVRASRGRGSALVLLWLAAFVPVAASGCRASNESGAHGGIETGTSAVTGTRAITDTVTVTGTLELRLRLAQDAPASLSDVTAYPQWAGANVGRLRDENWTRLDSIEPVVVLDGAGGAAPTARGALPAGRYDRVFVAAPNVTARDAGGRAVRLTSHIEPIARGFDMRPGGTTVITIEWTVLPGSSRSGGGYEVFVTDARLSPPVIPASAEDGRPMPGPWAVAAAWLCLHASTRARRVHRRKEISWNRSSS